MYYRFSFSWCRWDIFKWPMPDGTVQLWDTIVECVAVTSLEWQIQASTSSFIYGEYYALRV